MKFLRKESEEKGATIIYATHILDGLEDWVTGIIYLNHKGFTQGLDMVRNKEYSLRELIISNMQNDYDIMEEENIKEQEANKRKSHEIYGPQGGYSSGRSGNLNL